MTLRNIFINSAGRLRSGWRLVIFTVSFFLIFSLSQFLVVALVTAAFRQRGSDFLSSIWGLVLSNTLMLASASGVGYGLGRLFEGLPFAATGWGLHRGWIRDFVVGSALGGVSLSAAALIAFAASGLRFTAGGGTATSRAETILISLFAYILFAASEEALFRGYPLQTMKRAHLAWVSIVITSLLFGSAHLGNPNVVPGFTLVNTILAGVWLAAGFLKTRSLWFPLGLHWSW